jgi:hypothetical protein
MRLTTAPGAYSPVTSDFDQLRLKILKKKKMAVRSGWAQNIAFTSTESRFFVPGQDLDGPPANAYYPKVGIADNLPRPNVRGGAFGAKEEVRRRSEGVCCSEGVCSEQYVMSNNCDICGGCTMHTKHNRT